MKPTKHLVVQIQNLRLVFKATTIEGAKLRLEVDIPAKIGLVIHLTKKTGKPKTRLITE